MSKYPYQRPPRKDQLVVMRRIYARERQLVWGDIGSGKTKPTLDFIGVLLANGLVKRALICAPLRALFGTWLQQIELDLPNLNYSLMTKKSEPDWSAQCILTNYDYFIARRKKKRSKRTGKIIPDRYVRDKSRINALIEWNPEIVAIDESHRIKNAQSQSAKACHKLGKICKYAIALTGTPEGNDKILDLWSQFQFIYPGLLPPTFTDFKEEYCIMVNRPHNKDGDTHKEIIKFKNVKQLVQKIKPYMIRMRTPDNMLYQDIPYRVDLGVKAQKLYKQMAKDFLAEIDNEVVTASIALTKMMKLCQIAGGFIKDEDGIAHFVHNDKLEAMDEIIDELKESGVDRIVIFARFRWELEQIRKRLTSWPVYEISGRIKDPNQTKLAVELFNSDGGIMVCQSAAGSESLNLQSANYMIFYSIDYSYIHHVQARGRILRYGQKKTCYFYQLRARGTMDNAMYRALGEHHDANAEFKQLIEEVRSQVA